MLNIIKSKGINNYYTPKKTASVLTVSVFGKEAADEMCKWFGFRGLSPCPNSIIEFYWNIGPKSKTIKSSRVMADVDQHVI